MTSGQHVKSDCSAAAPKGFVSSFIMRPTGLISIALLLLGCALVTDGSAAAEQSAAQGDPIARLVERLLASHVWRNGENLQLKLPATASTDEVIARALGMTSFGEGRDRQYRILETRLVQISEGQAAQYGIPETRRMHIAEGLPYTYIAAHVRTELGDKIVLLSTKARVRVGGVESTTHGHQTSSAFEGSRVTSASGRWRT